tara:strand:+ start:369 stop:515 length:147 start_codon:yes stop_codon:yes gene_type:complete
LKEKKWTQKQKIAQIERITANLYIMVDKISKEIIEIKKQLDKKDDRTN